jgi:hypothetical protein
MFVTPESVFVPDDALLSDAMGWSYCTETVPHAATPRTHTQPNGRSFRKFMTCNPYCVGLTALLTEIRRLRDLARQR